MIFKKVTKYIEGKHPGYPKKAEFEKRMENGEKLSPEEEKIYSDAKYMVRR